MFFISLILANIATVTLLFVPRYFLVYLGVVILGSLLAPKPPTMLLFELCDSGKKMVKLDVCIVYRTQRIQIGLFNNGDSVTYLFVEFRSWTSVVDFTAFVFGFAAVPLIAYLFTDWFYIGLVTTVPTIILFAILATTLYIPESPRWLISVGRVEAAKKIIQKVAEVNKTSDQLTEGQLDVVLRQLVENQNKEPAQTWYTGFWTLLSKPRLAKNSILLALTM